MVILSQNLVICIILLILYLFKELRKQASDILLQTKMVDGDQCHIQQPWQWKQFEEVDFQK